MVMNTIQPIKSKCIESGWEEKEVKSMDCEEKNKEENVSKEIKRLANLYNYGVQLKNLLKEAETEVVYSKKRRIKDPLEKHSKFLSAT